MSGRFNMSSTTGPSQVLIIRHAEKLGDPKTDSDGGPDLSIRGSARAAALPSLFVPVTPVLSCPLHQTKDTFNGSYQQVQLSGPPPRFPAPDFIFATKKSHHSNRPRETITPLAAALEQTINHQYSNSAKDIADMGKEILNSGTYTGKIVLICWHHGAIPDVANALGVWQTPSWKGTVFDRVWQIAFA